MRNAGSMFHFGVVLYFLADTCKVLGRYDEGLTVIDEALQLAQHNSENWKLANLHRLAGELILARDGPDGWTAVESQFQQAIALAREPKARSLELRASTALAALLAMRREYAAALALLSPICFQCQEGHALPDYQEARALVEKLEGFTAG